MPKNARDFLKPRMLRGNECSVFRWRWLLYERSMIIQHFVVTFYTHSKFADYAPRIRKGARSALTTCTIAATSEERTQAEWVLWVQI